MNHKGLLPVICEYGMIKLKQIPNAEEKSMRIDIFADAKSYHGYHYY